MKQLKTIKKIIPEEYENYPIIKYLKIIQPSWTKVFAIKMIRTKNVLVNNKKTEINYKLQPLDEVSLTGIENKSKPTNLSKLKPLKVVFENEHLIIVDKEKNIPVQSNNKNPLNNMNNRLLNHLKFDINSHNWKPTFIHRLDQNTTGLLIGAKTYQSYIQLIQALKEKKIHKCYKALVHGLIPFKEKTININLIKKGTKSYISSKDNPKSKTAITKIKLEKHLFNIKSSLLEIDLITGKNHQIRVHLSNIGFPIRGDQKYGIEKDKKQYPIPALTAYKIVFDSELPELLKDIQGKTFLKEDIWFLT